MEIPELLAEPWAVQRDTFELIVKGAAGGHSIEQVKASSMGMTPEALRLFGEFPGVDDPLDVRDGVAYIPVRGFLTARSYWRGDRASHEWIRENFQLAMDRPDVDRVVLEVDSPGGQVSGCDEVTDLIFESRGVKPITAHILGQATSAAYWIASSADTIVTGRLSMLGSIGVMWTFVDYSKYEAELGIEEITIVSSQSPNKDIDPKSATGEALIKATVDQLAGEFVADVARNRGVSEETVVSGFGGGWVLVGESAVEAGMADSVGRPEDAAENSALGVSSVSHAPAAAGERGAGVSTATIKVADITGEWITKNLPAVAAGLQAGLIPEAKLTEAQGALAAAESTAGEARAQGATEERERIVGIMGLASTKVEGLTHSVTGVFDEQISAWVADPAVSLEAATKQYETLARGYDAAMKKSGLKATRDDEATLEVPDPTAQSEAAVDRQIIADAAKAAAKHVGL